MRVIKGVIYGDLQEWWHKILASDSFRHCESRDSSPAVRKRLRNLSGGNGIVIYFLEKYWENEKGKTESQSKESLSRQLPGLHTD